MKQLGSEAFVTVAVGRAWQTYNCDKLRLAMIGPRLPLPIRAVSSHRDLTFASQGADVVVFRRQEQTGRLVGAGGGSVRLMLNMGRTLLVVGEEQRLDVWAVDPKGVGGERVAQWTLASGQGARRVVTLDHPSTYLNKVLVGYSDGGLELWNFRSGKSVHVFNTSEFCPTRKDLFTGQDVDDTDEDAPPGVTCVAMSGVLDVAGVGMGDGTVIVHNLKYDKTIMRFFQDHGAATCMAFRRGAGPPCLVTGSSRGHLAIWDLKRKQLLTLLPNAHGARITSAAFIGNEGLLVTSGADNQLKMWVFDKPDGSPRLLKSRGGHRLPPTRIRFYRGRAEVLLTTGLDRTMRYFNLYRPQQSAELSQGRGRAALRRRAGDAGAPELGQIVDFVASDARERDWSNILSCHADSDEALTWRLRTKSVGPHRLGGGRTASARRRRVEVTSVAISACGNFGIIGTRAGHVEKYNMQSGQYRQSYPRGGGGGDGPQAHTRAVTALEVDGVNACLVSCSLDASVKIWAFHDHSLQATVILRDSFSGGVPSGDLVSIARASLCRESDLLAVATDDLCISVLDVRTRRVVRRFTGHTNRVTDMSWSNDGRWLATSCMDGCTRVFDVPSGRLIDWFRFSAPVTALAFSPKGDFLATAHVGNVGVFLWANKSYFSHLYLRAVPEAPINMDLRQSAAPAEPELEVTAADDEEKAESGGENNDDPFGDVTIEPVQKGMATLSNLPKSRWANLRVLDVIKKRNAPKEAPKAPPNAPFFLNVKTGLEPELAPGDDMKQMLNADGKKRKRPLFSEGQQSRVVLLLLEATSAGGKGSAQGEAKSEPAIRGKKRARRINGSRGTEADSGGDSGAGSRYARVTEYLRGLPPSKLDVEVQLLGMDPWHEKRDIGLMLGYFESELGGRANFEYLNAILGLFLKVHGEAIMRHVDLSRRVDALREAQKEGWRDLESCFHYTMCMASRLGGIQY